MHKTKTGIVKGKFAYLAPEALATKPLDRRADIWGLGVVLWELITQQRLFQRDSQADTVLAVATQPIQPPSVVRPGVPAALDAIVLKALSRDPAERYATARDLGRDLIRFIHKGAEPVGLSDLAEWMDRLFPGGRACKLQLLAMAGQLGGDLPTMVAPGSALRSIAPMTSARSVVDTPVPPSVRPTSDGWGSSKTMRRFRWRAGATAGLLVLAVMGGSLGMPFFRARSTGAVAAGASAPPHLGRASVLFPAPERAPAPPPDPPAEANNCAPERGTYILEVVPAADGDAHRLVLRAVPRDKARP
jgi:serine/threonine-protein kinase